MLVILILALAILFAASFLLVRNIITGEVKKNNRSMVSAYADFITDELQLADAPLDEALAPKNGLSIFVPTLSPTGCRRGNRSRFR